MEFHSIDENMYGLKERFHLSYEGGQHANNRRHGCRPWAPPRETEELARSAVARWSKLRGGSLYRVHQELARKR